jgi:hypothetical protein
LYDSVIIRDQHVRDATRLVAPAQDTTSFPSLSIARSPNLPLLRQRQ